MPLTPMLQPNSKDYLGRHWRLLGVLLGVVVTVAACTSAPQTTALSSSGGLPVRGTLPLGHRWTPC